MKALTEFTRRLSVFKNRGCGPGARLENSPQFTCFSGISKCLLWHGAVTCGEDEGKSPLKLRLSDGGRCQTLEKSSVSSVSDSILPRHSGCDFSGSCQRKASTLPQTLLLWESCHLPQQHFVMGFFRPRRLTLYSETLCQASSPFSLHWCFML